MSETTDDRVKTDQDKCVFTHVRQTIETADISSVYMVKIEKSALTISS